DIRGRIPDQLDEDTLFALGWATATTLAELHSTAEVVIGHDMRPSSPGFARAFAAGVDSAGATATLLGLCSTDQLYFASGIFGVPGAMITASHNPADYNGIKICGPHAAGVSLTTGLARIQELAPTAPRAAERPVAADASATAAMRERYVRRSRELTHVDEVTAHTVVPHAGRGTAGPVRVPFDVIGLFTALDGTFPPARRTRSNPRTSSTPHRRSSTPVPISAWSSTAMPTAASSSTRPERRCRPRRSALSWPNARS